MSYYGYPKYMTVEEKEARAGAAIEKLRKKNPSIRPVVIEGRTLAHTWWGKAWNTNLESYADYAYRIDRGRSYVRHRAVLDLSLSPGRVEALVQGSSSKPYEIEIDIKPLAPATWARITAASGGGIESLQELLEGKFPKAMADLFTAQEAGLFPAPQEIDLHCNCPDWAVMCKHVSAALYGVGARLDDNPALFFVLRDVNVDELVSRAIAEKSEALLKKSAKRSRRIIEQEDDDLEELFGIALEGAAEAGDPETGNSSPSPKPRPSSKGRGRRQSP